MIDLKLKKFYFSILVVVLLFLSLALIKGNKSGGGLCPRENRVSLQLDIFPTDSFGNCLMLSPFANTEFRAVFTVETPVNSSLLNWKIYARTFDILDDDDSLLAKVELPPIGFNTKPYTQACLGLSGAKCGEILQPGRNYSLHFTVLQGSWLPSPVFLFLIFFCTNFYPLSWFSFSRLLPMEHLSSQLLSCFILAKQIVIKICSFVWRNLATYHNRHLFF